jgi:hypothetical protein
VRVVLLRLWFREKIWAQHSNDGKVVLLLLVTEAAVPWGLA